MCQAITHMQSILYREIYFDVVYMSNEGRHIRIQCAKRINSCTVDQDVNLSDKARQKLL